MRRNINLNEILNRIKSLSEGPAPLVPNEALAYIRSTLERINLEVMAFFAKPRMIEELCKITPDPTFVDQFNTESAALARKLYEIGKHVRKRAKEYSEDCHFILIRELNIIGNDLMIVSQSIPSFEQGYIQPLSSLCKSLGGIFIAIGQRSLPTAGAESDWDGNIEPSTGICAGMVIDWSKQVVENGTPHYPITSNIDVQICQEAQQKIITAHYIAKGTSPTTTIDTANKLKLLERNYPYFISITNENKTEGHAIGIRKQSNFIEIFDPNYGYFFFSSIESASCWLNAVLRNYQSCGFPCDTIEFFRHKSTAASESSFPSNYMLNSVAFLPHTKNGRIELIQTYNKHIEALIVNSSEEKVTPILLTAFSDMFSLLSFEDGEHIIKIIKACKENTPYNDDEMALLKAKIYSSDVFRKNIDVIMDSIEKLHTNRKAIPSDIRDAIQTVNLSSERLLSKINTLTAHLITARRENNDKIIKLLVVEIYLLKSKHRILIDENIPAKLLSTIERENTPQFTTQKALQRLQSLTSIPSAETVTALAILLGKIEYAKNALAHMDAQLRNCYHPTLDLNAEGQNKASVYKIKIIRDLYGKLEQFRDAILHHNNDTRSFESELAPYIGDIHHLPEYKAENDYTLIIEAINHKLSSEMPKKYSPSELAVLNRLYGLLSSQPGSILHALNSLKVDNAVESSMKDAIDNLINQANRIRLFLINAVDPGKDKEFEVSHFVKLVRELSPSSVDENGFNIPGTCHNFSHYIQLLLLPNGILVVIKNRIASMQQSKNTTAVDYLENLYKRFNILNNQYQDGKITITDYTNHVCNDLNLPKGQLYNVTISLIEKAIDNKTNDESLQKDAPQKTLSQEKPYSSDGVTFRNPLVGLFVGFLLSSLLIAATISVALTFGTSLPLIFGIGIAAATLVFSGTITTSLFWKKAEYAQADSTTEALTSTTNSYVTNSLKHSNASRPSDSTTAPLLVEQHPNHQTSNKWSFLNLLTFNSKPHSQFIAPPQKLPDHNPTP